MYEVHFYDGTSVDNAASIHDVCQTIDEARRVKREAALAHPEWDVWVVDEEGREVDD